MEQTRETQEKQTVLTGAEWNVMECLWERAPRTGRETAERLSETVGWSRSTALTMLSRMEKKRLIGSREQEGKRVYFPLVEREDAAKRMTDDFLTRVYRGSVGAFLSAVTGEAALSEAEIAELYAILDKVKEAGK